MLRVEIPAFDNEKGIQVNNRIEIERGIQIDKTIAADKTIKMTVHTCFSYLVTVLMVMLDLIICVTRKKVMKNNCRSYTECKNTDQSQAYKFFQYDISNIHSGVSRV